MLRKRHPYLNHARGSILLLVLLIIAALSAIVFTTLTVVDRNMERVIAKSSEMDAMALAQKGVAIGTYPEILRDDPLLNYRSTERKEGYKVTIETEATRLHINGVLARGDKRLLADLFRSWGVETGAADEITDALVDWVDENELKELNGAEAEEYIALGFQDRPYNKDFLSVEDMRLVRGFHLVEQAKPNWADYFTIYGDKALDIHHTGVELLAIATESTEATVEPYVAYVRGDDGMVGTEDDFRYGNMDEALTALGVSAADEERARIRSRFRLNTTTRRVVSKGYAGETVKEIKVIVSGGRSPQILYHKETLIYKIDKNK